MKISIDHIRFINDHYHTAGDPAPNGIDDLVAKIGSQLGEVENVETIGDAYRGVVVAKVIECNDHPNADRLHVCLIDDGGTTPDVARNENGYVQVVCGAPNVRAGMTVAWLPPGSTVPESFAKDPFVLEARELRGVVSNGMLASPKELALGDSHDGILELDDDKLPGTPFAEAYGLDDTIIDIENKMFTHRPDCFGVLGVAREIAGIQGQSYKSPEWYTQHADVSGVETEGLPLHVENELPSLVPRFCAITMRDVHVGTSPVWLQVFLAKMGVHSINNIVDYTNYFMLLTGQPLHAYDYDKVRANSDGDQAVLVVRNPRENEKIALLNGKTIDPRQQAIMIATNKHLIGVGGVMGGSETEVDAGTKNIIIESATFDMYSVRRTSMEHGLFTDGVTRFSKGQSPLQNRAVLAKIVSEIQMFAGGKIASDIIDINQVEGREWVHPPVPVSVEFINSRLGLKLSAQDMQQLLQNVEFAVAIADDALTVTAPFWRTDIETREDVVEEVGRLYGFDKLPLELPLRNVRPVQKDSQLELKSRIREMLVKCGANEVLTYSFVHGNLLDRVGQDKSQAFQLSNALSPDLQYYRLSLTPSLLDKIHPNIKAGYEQFALFEIGKSHHAARSSDEGLPIEEDVLALVVAARNPRSQGAAYYEARAYLDYLATKLGIVLEFVPRTESPDDETAKPFVANRSANVCRKDSGAVIGIVGEYTQSTQKNLKLPAYAAGFEVRLEGLMATEIVHAYAPLSRFPSINQDLSLRVSANVTHGELRALIDEVLASQLPEHTSATLTPLGIYAPADNEAVRHHSFRIEMVNFARTMMTSELSEVIDRIAAAAQERLSAERL